VRNYLMIMMVSKLMVSDSVSFGGCGGLAVGGKVHPTILG
jgi:hypothetical protein